jgi:hypothetical protein
VTHREEGEGVRIVTGGPKNPIKRKKLTNGAGLD